MQIYLSCLDVSADVEFYADNFYLYCIVQQLDMKVAISPPSIPHTTHRIAIALRGDILSSYFILGTRDPA